MSWHPMVVHFPLVLLPLSVAVDLVGWIGRRPDWHRGAYYLLVLGVLSALTAVFSGNEAALPFRGDAELVEHIEEHEDLATLVLFFFLGVAFGRLPLQLQGRLDSWGLKSWILAAGIGCALLWQTGFYGGELVYEYGVGVR